MFSEKTLWCLHEAGWHKNYVADISIYQQSTASVGQPLPEIVLQFLRRYGCLKIKYRRAEPYNSFFLDGDKLSEPLEDLVFFAAKTGIDVIHRIGYFDDYEGLLLMSNDGKVYLFYGYSKGGEVMFVADSGEAAIEAICANKRFPQIKEW